MTQGNPAAEHAVGMGTHAELKAWDVGSTSDKNTPQLFRSAYMALTRKKKGT